MERPMLPTNSLIETNPIFYKYEDCRIEILPYFLYEVSVYKIEPKRANILLTKYYTSNKLLKVKGTEVIKRFNKFNIECFVILLGAPQSFIKEYNLPEIKTKKS